MAIKVLKCSHCCRHRVSKILKITMFLDIPGAWARKTAHMLLPRWNCANCRIVSETNQQTVSKRRKLSAELCLNS